MSDPPEVLTESDGKWVRRDVFLDEFDDDDADPDAVLDELIDDGVMEEKIAMGGYVYVRGVNRAALVKELASAKASLATDRIRDRAADVVGWGDDT